MIYKTTQYINLHSANLEITSCELTNIIDGEINVYGTRNITYIHKLQIVALDFVVVLHPDEYNLIMTYKGVIDNDIGGFMKMPYINATGHKKWLIATNNSVTGMRRLFPCWDEPRLKSKFTISIKYPKHFDVFPNTHSPLILHTSEQTTTRFATTPEIPTYRIAILLLDKKDYIHISPKQKKNKIILKSWKREWMSVQWDEIFGLMENVTSTVESISPQPRSSLLENQYAIAGLKDGSVDKLQFILYREEDIYNKEIDPIARKIELSRIIGRKVVGQLFGTAVSPSWWSYMWLNEGIATLFGVTGSLDDFLTVMQSVYDSQTMDLEKISVKDLMNPWIQKKQYPIVNVTEIFDTEWTRIVLETASKNWTVPLTNQVYINLKRILPKFCLTRAHKHFLAVCYNSEHSQFIIINRQQTGYYRVFYNRESWLRIVSYLNSENFTNINVLNRAQLIDDTFHLTISGELDSSVFWEVISYLKWETDYVAWYPIFKAIEHESHTLLFPNVNTTNFKMKLRELLISLLIKIGYEEEPNDNSLIKCLRQEALRWACVLDDSECKKYAKSKLQWHLSNPTENKLLPWWREWTFCNGLSVSSISLDKLFKDLDEISKIKDSEMLKPLACCTDNYSLLSFSDKLKILRNFYVFSYTEDNARRICVIKNYIYWFYYIIQNHIQKWIRKNLANSLLQNTEHKIKMRLKKHYNTIDDVCKMILL
ncbi:hypothetical protein P5V15_009965 [Pogonomyrmex californicus]